jgi:transposase
MEVATLLTLKANITDEDWQRTPASVISLLKAIFEHIEQQDKRIAALEEENRYLREQQGRNSANSSQPPSSDSPAKKPEKKLQKSGKRRGGQKGHPGYSRELIEVEKCQKVEDHIPKECNSCGNKLEGIDPAPYRHQVVELPPLEPYVEEHRLHQLECSKCGAITRAKLPEGVPASGYGARVVAIAAVLSGLYRMSERMCQTAFRDLFGIVMALGTVNRLRQEASQAIAEPVEKAAEYVKKQSMINSDETGFTQGNADGLNPEKHKAWLWVAVTELVTVFRVALSRGQDGAQLLLGTLITAILITDRWNGYNWVSLSQRQLCWAHLKRDFTKISEREGVSGRIGEKLLEQEKLLFTYWHRVRDGTLQRSSFKTYAANIRLKIKALLQQGADYDPKPKEKTARAMTARTCKELLKLEPAMWLFVRVEGLEPTNNAAEQAIRHFVLWRKNSFGSQSAEGSLFVARILTVVMTLRSQQRNVLDYMVEACQAFRLGKPAPSLLPKISPARVQLRPAA